MKSESTKRRFANACFDVWNTAAHGYHVYREMRYWQDELYPLYDGMINRWNFWPPGEYAGGIDYMYIKNEINGLFDRIVPRHGYTMEYLRQKFALAKPVSHINLRANDLNGGTVKLNAIEPDLSNGSWGGFYPTDITQKLVAMPNEGYDFTGWEVSDGSNISIWDDTTAYLSLGVNGAIVTAKFQPKHTGEPIVIKTAEDLNAMADGINSNSPDYSGRRQYILENDLYITDHTPIGTETYPFTGSFDGNYHTISGMNVVTSKQGAGLFGYVGEGGSVKNTGVTNITINASTSNGKNVGGIAGRNYGDIENCYTTGNITGYSTVGGIVGNNTGAGSYSGTVKNCYSTAGATATTTAVK